MQEFCEKNDLKQVFRKKFVILRLHFSIEIEIK